MKLSWACPFINFRVVFEGHVTLANKNHQEYSEWTNKEPWICPLDRVQNQLSNNRKWRKIPITSETIEWKPQSYEYYKTNHISDPHTL